MIGSYPLQIRRKIGLEYNPFKPGQIIIRSYTGKGLIKPGAYIAIHDVIQRFRSVPLFPKRGSALVDPVPPAGKAMLVHYFIGNVRMPVVRQSMQQVFGAQDAAIQVVIALLYRRNQCINCLFSVISQALVKGAGKSRLAAGIVNAFSFIILFIERLSDFDC